MTSCISFDADTEPKSRLLERLVALYPHLDLTMRDTIRWKELYQLIARWWREDHAPMTGLSNNTTLEEKQLRDEMMSPMNRLERTRWLAERAYSITGVLTLAKEEK